MRTREKCILANLLLMSCLALWAACGPDPTDDTLAVPCDETSAESLCGSLDLCVDGYCCDMPCDHECVACNLPGLEGICSYVEQGEDPRDDCREMIPSTCGTTGVCDGEGACEWHDDTVECGTSHCPPPHCEDLVYHTYPPQCVHRCDGEGDCADCVCLPETSTVCRVSEDDECCVARCTSQGCITEPGYRTCSDVCTPEALFRDNTCVGCGENEAAGTCVAGEVVECDETLLCRQFSCGDSFYWCTYLEGAWAWRTTSACDDGDPCTVDTDCASGACVGTAVECEDGAYCDDSGECVVCDVDEHCGSSCEDCTQHGMRCNAEGEACVQCVEDDDCPEGQRCLAPGICVLDCAPGWASCDGDLETGCETFLGTVDNCGECGNDCSDQYPNSSVSCVDGVCRFDGCLPGWVNLDGDPSTGCEYECTPIPGPDLPDDDFIDSNCDGIDGDIDAAIFVSPLGDDTNPGTIDQPKRTMQAAISAAASVGRDVYAAAGNYPSDTVMLANGVSVYGGYDPVTWQRSNTNHVVIVHSGQVESSRIVGIQGHGITSATVIDRISVQTPHASGDGVGNYAFHCSGCSGLRLHRSNLSAGNGSPGAAGIAGSDGASGSPGGSGSPGHCDEDVFAAGGSGGSSPCGRAGGSGGRGSYGNNFGLNGHTGQFGVPGGAGGHANGCTGMGHGSPGSDGPDGDHGTDGDGGSGGELVQNYWSARSGSIGTSGAHGNGGGGGGGGGGRGGLFCIDGTGNGGGGGGGGGCRGVRGSGGGGGGGSFGLFLVGSTGAQLTSNTITSGAGGRGGAGGYGGCPGSGGARGVGAEVCLHLVGRGGDGGRGGNGGRGGHGGGGAGGASYAVYRSNTAVSLAGNDLAHGAGGQGGSAASRWCSIGGTMTGNPGTAGASGMTN